MKRTELAKQKGLVLREQLKRAGPPERFGKGSGAPLSRREQRDLERAQGLVPFAVKLDAELVKRLHDLARERQAEVGQVVTELLNAALERGEQR